MNPLFLLCGGGMMLVAVVAVGYWKAKSNIHWKFFMWGALAWIVGVSLKSGAAFALSHTVGSVRHILPRYFSEPFMWLYAGLMTGVFECGATLGFAYIRKIRTADWKETVGFGLSFGAFEAFFLGACSFILVTLVILIPDKLPPQLIKFATLGSHSLLIIPASTVERIIVTIVHTFSCVLILYAVRTSEWKWFWLSFFYKAAIDAIGGFILNSIN